MATLALAGVALIPGVNIAAPVLFGLGMLTSFVDARYIMPNLFPADAPKNDPDNMEKISITTSSEGASLPYSIGKYNFIPGVIVARSIPTYQTDGDLEATIGKGGGGGDRPSIPPQKRWYADVAVCFGERETCPDSYGSARAIDDILTLRANGRLIWAKELTVSQASNQIGNLFLYAGIYPYTIFAPYPHDDINFNEFVDGYSVTISGWQNSNNNGTAKLLYTYVDATQQYMVLDKYGYVEPAGTPTVTVYQSITGYKAEMMTTAPHIYKGGSSQSLDASDPMRYGEVYWNNYRHRVVVSFAGLQLTQFSNSLPRFEAELVADNDESFTYRQAITELIGRGKESTFVNVDDVDEYRFIKGYTVYGQRKISQTLQPLMLAGNILCQESGSELRFFSRENADSVVIAEDDLGCSDDETKIEPLYEIIREEVTGKIPRSVAVEFFNIHNNNEKATAIEHIDLNFIGQTTKIGDDQKYEIPISMSLAEASAIAKRLLFMHFADQTTIKIAVDFKYSRVLPGDVVTFISNGESYKFIVKTKERGCNGLIILSGPTVFTELDSITWSDQEANRFLSEEITGPGIYDFDILDFAPFTDDAAFKTGLYFYAGKLVRGQKWKGCAVFESTDDSDYFQVAQLPISAYCGRCKEALGGSINPAQWDDVNTVDICLTEGELESITDSECIDGKNRIAIKTSEGWEVIGFVNAVLQYDPNTPNLVYRLSRLIRGLCNTEAEIDNHEDYSKFIILNGPGIYFHRLNQRRHKADFFYKCVPVGGDESDYAGVEHNHALGTVRPYAPCQITGVRDGSNNLTISWMYRSRHITRQYAARKPMIDAPETYKLQIWNSGRTAKLREWILNSTSQEYTAAQQTTDGLTPGDDVTISLFQVSPIIGDGIEAQEII